MKTILKNSPYFFLTVLLGLLPFFGCGGDEAPEVPLNGTLLGEFQFPKDATGPLWQVSDAYIAELLNMYVPPDWHKAEDEETYVKYRFAQLLKQFGDIPELRYLIAYDQHPGEKTHPQRIARMEAIYRLFPNEQNRKALQQLHEILDFIENPPYSNFEREWAQEDPEGYYKYLLENLIRDYGDIPEVYTVARLQTKIFRGKQLTHAEDQAHSAAMEYLMSLDAQREEEQDEVPDD